MFYNDLQDTVDNLVTALQAPHLLEPLDAFSQQIKPLRDGLMGIASGGDKQAGAATATHQHLHAVRTVLTNVDPVDLVEAIRLALIAIAEASGRATRSGEVLAALKSVLEEFRTRYSEYLRKQSAPLAVDLLFAAGSLRNEIFTAVTAFQYVLGQLATPLTNEEDQTLRIELFVDANAKRVAEKVAALNILYEELARLLGSNTVLRIQRIEAGSVAVEAVGAAAVIIPLLKILNDYLSYLYRTRTREGKIAAVKLNTEALISVINLDKRMKTDGMEVPEVTESIRLAAANIGKAFVDLTADVDGVKVNHQEFSDIAELRKQLPAPRDATDQPSNILPSPDNPPTPIPSTRGHAA